MRRDGIGDANRPIVARKQLCISILDLFPPRVLPAHPAEGARYIPPGADPGDSGWEQIKDLWAPDEKDTA